MGAALLPLWCVCCYHEIYRPSDKGYSVRRSRWMRSMVRRLAWSASRVFLSLFRIHEAECPTICELRRSRGLASETRVLEVYVQILFSPLDLRADGKAKLKYPSISTAILQHTKPRSDTSNVPLTRTPPGILPSSKFVVIRCDQPLRPLGKY